VTKWSSIKQEFWDIWVVKEWFFKQQIEKSRETDRQTKSFGDGRRRTIDFWFGDTPMASQHAKFRLYCRWAFKIGEQSTENNGYHKSCKYWITHIMPLKLVHAIRIRFHPFTTLQFSQSLLSQAKWLSFRKFKLIQYIVENIEVLWRWSDLQCYNVANKYPIKITN
jgi:hypothetical protein